MRTKFFATGLLLTLAITLTAQEVRKSVIPLIGSEAPAFTAETTNGTINFPGDFGRHWKILFSHPRDYTPVCTTELMELARLQDRFDALNIKVAVISTDDKDRHLGWIKSMNEMLSTEKNQPKIKFPLIDDSSAKISLLYGMLHEPVSTTKDVRGVFIISPSDKVEATFFYPNNVGRNMEEIIRTVQALQTTASTKLLTPANWKPGEKMLVPYFPYTEKELANNPDIVKQYTKVGSMLWYKEVSNP